MDPDPHRETTVPTQYDRGDTRQLFESIFYDIVRDPRQRDRVIVFAVQRQPQDGLGIGVRLCDHRLFDVHRQPAANPRDPVADVVRGGLDIPIQFEFDRDPRRLFLARRRHVLDAFDPVDRTFDDLGHRGFDNLCRSTVIHGDDRNFWRIDVGHFAVLQPRGRDQAD